MNFLLDGYKADKKIGKGSFGKVYVYKHSQSPSIAVKILKKKTTKQKHVDRELIAISRLKHHDHVLDFYYHEEIEEKIHIYMELCDGNLTDYLKAKALTSNKKVNILAQIADGMQFIHKHRIIHKDLKPDNVLIKNFDSEELIVKITDFGLAYPMLENEQTATLSLSFGGSRAYMAPELLKVQLTGDHSIKRDYKVDVWSFGVITYKVMKGEHPFKFVEVTTTFNAASRIPQDFAEFNDQNFIALLVKIFDQDSNKRPTMKEVFDSL